MGQTVLTYPSTNTCFSEFCLERSWDQGKGQRCQQNSEAGTQTCVSSQMSFIGECFPMSKCTDLDLTSSGAGLSYCTIGDWAMILKLFLINERGVPLPQEAYHGSFAHYRFKVLFMSIKVVLFPTKDLFLFLTISNINSKSRPCGCGPGSKMLILRTARQSLSCA